MTNDKARDELIKLGRRVLVEVFEGTGLAWLRRDVTAAKASAHELAERIAPWAASRWPDFTGEQLITRIVTLRDLGTPRAGLLLAQLDTDGLARLDETSKRVAEAMGIRSTRHK